MTPLPDLDLTRDALATSTLSHGLQLLGDRWTVALILGAYLGIRRFNDWQTQLGIPRHTLTERLKSLMALGVLCQRPYQERPLRHSYHLTQKGLALYDHVLMMWAWERRWGSRDLTLPKQLRHTSCGHTFVPELRCTACSNKVGIIDLTFSLQVEPLLKALPPSRLRAARLPADAGQQQIGLGLLVDRWAVLIISAVMLGCHYFDQLSHVLGIGSSVLSGRLASMVDTGLLLCQSDLRDARRKVYRLTPASNDLFGYIICFSSWASHHHFHAPSAIVPTHKGCGQPFTPTVGCSHCQTGLKAWDVLPSFQE